MSIFKRQQASPALALLVIQILPRHRLFLRLRLRHHQSFSQRLRPANLRLAKLRLAKLRLAKLLLAKLRLVKLRLAKLLAKNLAAGEFSSWRI